MNFEEIKKCPLCGGDLEEGYLNAPRAIYWDTHKHIAISGGPVVLGSALEMTNIPSKRCTECNVIMFNGPITPASFLKKCIKCAREIPIASEECQYCGKRQPSGK